MNKQARAYKLYQQGCRKSAIAERLGVGVRMVYRYIEQEELSILRQKVQNFENAFAILEPEPKQALINALNKVRQT